jgi:O-acetyl-ADP-ribose deacetylase (regulator of RNase III)
MKISSENVYKATRASLLAADAHGFESLAIPGMRVGVGGVRTADAADLMFRAIREFSPDALAEIILVDLSPEMIDCWGAST